MSEALWLKVNCFFLHLMRVYYSGGLLFTSNESVLFMWVTFHTQESNIEWIFSLLSASTIDWVWWNHNVYSTDDAVMLLINYFTLKFVYFHIYYYLIWIWFIDNHLIWFWCKCRNFRSSTTVFQMSTMCRHCLQ